MASIVDPKVNADTQVEDSSGSQFSKRAACIELLNQWLADESGYDEAAWPKIKKAIEGNHTSTRLPIDE